MADLIMSAVARATEELATSIRRLTLGSSRTPSSIPSYNIQKIQEDIERLSRTLVRIRARVSDAEKIEIRVESARLWLRELEGVAYAAEDVLDELLYEMLRLRWERHGLLQGGHIEEVTGASVDLLLQVSDSSIASRAHEIVAFLHDVEHRIEGINLRFQEISDYRVALQLDESDGQRRVGLEIPVRQPTTSLMEEPRIVGREEDLKLIKKFLLSDDESSGGSVIPVMVIVGMGGVGKTTLAQLAYNDDEVSKQFDLKSWVCISEDFDLVQLTRAMLESFTGVAWDLSQLDPLQIKLKGKLAGKQFLLVLDDVWEPENLLRIWDRLRAPFLDASRGSKIMITTRTEEVSRMSGVVSKHHLLCLPDGECLQLFTQRAFEGRDPASLHPNLMTLGKRISKKCRGVPLVAKILGGQLRWEDDVQKWRDILEGDIWDIDKKGIMPVLRSSYDHLPTNHRQCFRYCSLFPKGYPFRKDQLVRMWMAQGYIKARGTRQVEDIGNEYFDDLLWRSFFQCRSNPEIFYMHDLIHDLARHVSRGECYSLEDRKPWNKSEGDVRHFSIISSGEEPMRGLELITAVDEPIGTLRSLLFFNTGYYPSCKMEHLNDVITRMKHLRVLDLSCTDIDHLPDSIGCLKHIRYLALRSTYIKQLPESVGTLHHLQTLDLDDCDLAYLPNSITQLLNLRHLICDYDFAYLVGLGRLTNLQMVPRFVVSSEHGRPKLGELQDMKNIRSLHISSLNVLTDLHEAKKACLQRKERLCDLHLEWSHHPPSPLDDDVLEILRPHSSLRVLKITGFRGLSVPSWLEDQPFSDLVSIHLDSCETWASLPPFGRLPSLKHLCIWSAHEVEHIGREFFSGGFPRLEKLHLRNLYKWKSWCGAKKGECPCLRKLDISCCWGLSSLSLNNLDALQVLKIKECMVLELSTVNLQLVRLPSLQRIEILDIVGARYVSGKSLGGFRQLEALDLNDVCRWPAAVELDFSCLRRLELRYCAELTSIPLQSLGALEALRIKDCPRLRFSNMELLPSTLKKLTLHGCPLLALWCRQQTQRVDHIPKLDIEGGDLHHLVLRNVLSEEEASHVGLSDVEDLRKLELEWDRDVSVEVLENLQPHTKLEELVIQGYAGSSFATWVGDPSFSNLVSVTFHRCSECKLLPPFGRLPCLKELYIGGIDMLACIGDEFFRGDISCGLERPCAFPSLARLEFDEMPLWEEWLGAEEGDLPSLHKLTIKCCSGLRVLPHLPLYLRELELEACGLLTFGLPLTHLLYLQTLRISSLPSLRELPELPYNLNKLVLKSLPKLATLGIPPTIRNLTLDRCNDMAILAVLPCLTNLTYLQVTHLTEITKSLPLHSLVSLRELYISGCPELELLDCINVSSTPIFAEGLQTLESLKHLSLTDCPRLCFSESERPPSTLEYMTVADCPLLVPWCHMNASRLQGICQIWVDGKRICSIKKKRALGIKRKRERERLQDLG